MKTLLQSDLSLFRDARSIIAESIWFDSDGSLRWCDIDAGTVHRSPLTGDITGADDGVISLPAPLSAFQPLASGDGFVFAGLDYVAVASGEATVTTRLAEFDHHSDHIRFNEAKCDPAGRFVVGSMNLHEEPDAAIYSVDETGRVRTLIGGIGVANGFEWSPDGRTMWFTDTASKTIYVGDYLDDGQLANVRPFAHGLASDGLARDANGGFWNGIYDSGRVVHWDADGNQDLEFDVPAGHVTSVGFGGENLSTLFIGTARENLTEEQLGSEPLTGSIFRIDTATHGFPVRPFGTPRKGN